MNLARPRLADRDPFRVGAVAIVAAAVLGLVVMLLSVVHFGAHTYTAVLAQTAGLRPTEDVDVDGVPVGSVKSVALDGARVRVEFTLDSGIRLGSRTTAAVKVATLLGTHYLAVNPAGSGELADGTIPLSRTSVPFNLQDVLNKGTRALQRLDAKTLAKALTAVSRTLTASKDDIGPALTGVTRLSQVIASRQEQIGDLLTAAHQVTGQLADGSGDLVALMKQATLVLDEVTRRREAIHTLLVETTALSNNLAAIIRQTRADVGPALVDFNAVLATLRHQDRTLGKLITTMAPAVRYVANATGNGPWGDLWLQDPAIPADDSRCRLEGCR